MNDQATGLPLFVTGRLCLFGEHSDWAAELGMHKGHCLVIGTDQGLRAEASASDQFVVETVLANSRHAGGPSESAEALPVVRKAWPLEESALMAAAQNPDEFFRYAAGAACQVVRKHHPAGGIHLKVTAIDLPLRKGVASSAAICTLVAKAFDRVQSLNLLPSELMEIAYQGEKLTGSQCGRMDQACIYGKTPVLLTFAKGADARIEPVFPGGRIDMFFVDLAGTKDTVRILADLADAYPTSPDLQHALGDHNEQIVRRAYRALEAGDARAIGSLMTQAQELFDRQVAPHSQSLESPLLHKLLAWPELRPHIWGGKGVGSQGDGTAQFVARSAKDRDEAMAHILQAFPPMQSFPLTISTAKSEALNPKRSADNSVSDFVL